MGTGGALQGLKIFFSANPKVLEIRDVNQERCASQESKQSRQHAVFTITSAPFS
jgi:hypothetical protein